MMGTPIANRPEGLWSQIYFLDSGKSLGTNYQDFKDSVKRSNNLDSDVASQEILIKKLGSLFEDIESFAIRETKAGYGLRLPKKEFENIHCEWPSNQFELYLRIKDEQYALVREDKFQIEISEIALKKLTRLLQTASNPLLIDKRFSEELGKFAYLSELLNKIRKADEKQ